MNQASAHMYAGTKIVRCTNGRYMLVTSDDRTLMCGGRRHAFDVLRSWGV